MPLRGPLLTLLLTGTLFSLGGCSGLPQIGMTGRVDQAESLARQGGLARADITAPPFILASWQHITDPSKPAHIYIEGDGAAWLSRSTPSRNPTPKHPIALSLAAQDPSANVIYIARPCQFTPLGVAGNQCPDDYWRGKRFAPEVIDSYMSALDRLAMQIPQGFHLIGFSGGANVAGLIAARRSDVLSLRTVAGNIDNDFFIKLHEVSDMPRSMNMADKVEKLKNLPQLHFIGGRDEIVTPAIFKNYFNKSGGASCIHYKVLDKNSHIEGWEEDWANLLSLPLNCF